jgi:hypothetical protein
MAGEETTYRHTQKAPIYLLLVALSLVFFITAFTTHDVPPIRFLFPVIGTLMLVLAASFRQLTVADEGDRLAIQFGPLPLFRRSVHYDQLIRVETGKTTLLDGWGIHLSLRGGWVWNLWGWDCVVLTLRDGVLRVGTDDAEHLARFLRDKRKQFEQSPHAQDS